MPITGIIIDDEVRSCNVLKRMLQEYAPEINIIDVVHSAADGIMSIKSNNPDLIFLDIQMPQGDGFQVLEHFDHIPFKVIFTTAYDQYAIKAIKFSALDFLLKPIDIEELQQAISKIKNVYGQQEDSRFNNLKEIISQNKKAGKIALSTQDEIKFVQLTEIIRMEANGNYTSIFLSSGEKVLVTQTLKFYEDLLKDDFFLRVHHSHLINLKKVNKYLKGNGGHAVMEDGTKVEISVRRKESFLTHLLS